VSISWNFPSQFSNSCFVSRTGSQKMTTFSRKVMSWWNSMDFLAWWHPRWADQRIAFCFWFDRSFFGHVESTWAWSKICWAICSCTIHESNKYSWLVTLQSADKTVWSTLPGKEGWEACNELSNLQRTSEPVQLRKSCSKRHPFFPSKNANKTNQWNRIYRNISTMRWWRSIMHMFAEFDFYVL